VKPPKKPKEKTIIDVKASSNLAKAGNVVAVARKSVVPLERADWIEKKRQKMDPKNESSKVMIIKQGLFFLY